jgi:hypothetical protein
MAGSELTTEGNGGSHIKKTRLLVQTFAPANPAKT